MLEKSIQEFRAIALMSVLGKWYAALVVRLLREELEPIELKEMHANAERGVDCEHVQAFFTNI